MWWFSFVFGVSVFTRSFSGTLNAGSTEMFQACPPSNLYTFVYEYSWIDCEGTRGFYLTNGAEKWATESLGWSATRYSFSAFPVDSRCFTAVATSEATCGVSFNLTYFALGVEYLLVGGNTTTNIESRGIDTLNYYIGNVNVTSPNMAFVYSDVVFSYVFELEARNDYLGTFQVNSAFANGSVQVWNVFSLGGVSPWSSSVADTVRLFSSWFERPRLG